MFDAVQKGGELTSQVIRIPSRRRRVRSEWMESNVQEFNQIFTRSDF